ncbi:MAG: hypothetical protein IJU26_08715, partial [Synergistaceae bacterium]|nr:hypothetical protein [Synergistaceae bacterium]
MKKLLALVLVMGLVAGVCSGEEIAAWDIDERIHPLLKQHLAAKAPRIITSESLPALRKALTVPAETLPKN